MNKTGNFCRALRVIGTNTPDTGVTEKILLGTFSTNGTLRNFIWQGSTWGLPFTEIAICRTIIVIVRKGVTPGDIGDPQGDLYRPESQVVAWNVVQVQNPVPVVNWVGKDQMGQSWEYHEGDQLYFMTKCIVNSWTNVCVDFETSS